jgi:hypothetical protein
LIGWHVRREELNQPLFAAIDAFEYPELHDESIAARNFFRHLAKLMSACGVKDFGIKVRCTPATTQPLKAAEYTAVAAADTWQCWCQPAR